ncbi:NAD(P)H oxidoreductase [Chitinophaga sp. SYP-B3965]|uniref:glutathione-regulated potassium-efflux system oxidoreductase KefF n=1 Tax=Chitinophaga sp. SYP-B3965 TaxID=2663120 RepID=UPI0012995697|nr:NAD(P)H-dependent oxidoreductase [Chitinophaga sp. SYP-B3965]MRG47495.1 NAD(P)H oxidoreductase [Chitinophaga sp. SYP-B3965]
MAKILILFAHPAFERSRIHAALLKATAGLQDVTVHDLYEAYPDFDVVPKIEQKLLTEHDVIIFQHPFYWYSGPALLKQWLDLVLLHGWAYGHEGVALKGKYLMNVISTGGKEMSYSPEGHHGYPLKQFMLPFLQTATLCHMHYLPPFVVHDANELNAAQLDKYAEAYAKLLKGFQSGNIALPEAQRQHYMNALVGAPTH